MLDCQRGLPLSTVVLQTQSRCLIGEPPIYQRWSCFLRASALPSVSVMIARDTEDVRRAKRNQTRNKGGYFVSWYETRYDFGEFSRGLVRKSESLFPTESLC